MKLRMQASVVALMFALWFTPTTWAQTAVDTTKPEAVAAELYTRLKASDWKGAAALFDDGALKSFRGMLQPIADAASASDQEAGAALFGGIKPEALKQASDAEFFALFMGNMMSRLSSLGGGLGPSQIIGSVAEGEDLRHVVTRTNAKAMGISITKMEVVSMRRRGDAWKVLLNGEMEGMAKAIQAMAAAKAGAGAPAAESDEKAPEADGKTP